MSVKNHPLFTEFPLTGEEEISIGSVPVPYHIYDGDGLFIGGTADLQNITDLLKNEQVTPIQTTSGRAVMGIWVVDFTEASLGPHNELQFSILVSHQPTSPIEDHPLTLLKALFSNADARMLCYGLWNNTDKVVAYNRELLGLDAQLNEGMIAVENGRKKFHFADESGNLLFTGDVKVEKRSAPKVGMSMLRLFGLRQTMRASAQDYLGAKVVNPISEKFPYNGDAQSYLASDTPIVQFFDPASDTISFDEQTNNIFKFEPQFVEHFSPFRFVYLHPEKVTLA